MHSVGKRGASCSLISFKQLFASALPQVFIGLNKMDLDNSTSGRLRFEQNNSTNREIHWPADTHSLLLSRPQVRLDVGICYQMLPNHY